MSGLTAATPAAISTLFGVTLPQGLPSLLPNLVFAVVIAVVLGVVLARPLHVARWRLALWLVCLVLPIALTWTVSVNPAIPGCSWGAPFWEGGWTDEVDNNIAMFIPAGAAAWLWPELARRRAALVAALMAPVVVEVGQLLMPWLQRACQVGDIANNCLGVLVGFGAVGVVAALRPLASRRP